MCPPPHLVMCIPCSSFTVCTLLILPLETSLTPHILLHTLSTMKWFWDYCGLLHYLGVPWPVVTQIRDSHSYLSEDEKRTAGLRYYLQTVPGVSWGRIAGVLWFMKEHCALETVRQYLPPTHGKILYEGCCVMVTCMWVAETGNSYTCINAYVALVTLNCSTPIISPSLTNNL